jgi:hypothetical protein
MLDSTLLRAWIANFYGYGRWTSPYWFIGLEEGGVNGEGEFADRLRAWSGSGSYPLVDLRDFHVAIRKLRFFSGGIPLQPTWRPLMRVLFVAEGRDITTKALRFYQANRLGRFDEETTLLELSPLPAKGTEERWFRDHELLGKIELEALKHRRRDQLKELIKHHKPRAVVTYGDMTSWQESLSLGETSWAFRAGRYESSVIVASHPPGKNAPTNAHWDQIGKYIREALGEGSAP